jgi:hypothetical protein
MQRISAFALGGVILLCAVSTAARADWVELANNDLIQGEVVSLDDDQLKLKSVNFGVMTIPRDKVRLIGLGDRPLPPAPQPAAQGPQQLGSQLPSLQNAQLNQLLQQVLGGGGIAELQQKMNKTKDDLKKLQRDMGSTPEAEALDSYLQIFELFGNLAPRSNPPAPRVSPKPTRPKADQQPKAEPQPNNQPQPKPEQPPSEPKPKAEQQPQAEP